MRKVIGTTIGTGATLNVEVGFKPDKVSLYNKTTRTKLDCSFTRVTLGEDGVGGGKVHTETVTGHGMNTAADGVRAAMVSAAAGLAQYAGADGSAAKGFTIGATATPNVDTNVIVWEAEQFD